MSVENYQGWVSVKLENAGFFAFYALDSVGIEIQPVQKPEKQNCHQNHDNEKQPAKKPDLPLVLRKPAFISMSVHKKL